MQNELNRASKEIKELNKEQAKAEKAAQTAELEARKVEHKLKQFEKDSKEAEKKTSQQIEKQKIKVSQTIIREVSYCWCLFSMPCAVIPTLDLKRPFLSFLMRDRPVQSNGTKNLNGLYRAKTTL